MSAHLNQSMQSSMPSASSKLPITVPPIPSIENLDRVCYFFGYPISHSLSPAFHAALFSSLNLNYQQLPYESESIEPCMALTKDPKFLGASITMPLKLAIIPYLDRLTPEGEAIGAINTIYWQTLSTGERLLCGTNSDCVGIREAVKQNVDHLEVLQMKGKPGLVIGGGGTCRTAIYALKHFFGCSEIYLVNRDKSEVDAVVTEWKSKGMADGLRYISSVAEVKGLEPPKIIISAIPNITPRTDEEIATRHVIEAILDMPEKGVLLEMCYHPVLNTEITVIARSSGWRVIPGTEAMIWQGFEQGRIWLETDLTSQTIDYVKDTIRSIIDRF
ncbi:quinate 5-dehydrogenase-like protein [Xylogone sp. PMI_703]|nr:quinate 5-dehydrogenase-like protein [Xylogone sp. PMI_703]